MCSKVIPGSGVKKLVLYAVDIKGKKRQTIFVAKSEASSSPVSFVTDIWLAQTWDDRKQVERVIDGIRRRAKRDDIFTHEAICMMAIPDEKYR